MPEKIFIYALLFSAYFATELDTGKDKFMQLLYINGVSALLGIARGKVETITASAFNAGKISIPFVNVLDYYREITSESKG